MLPMILAAGAGLAGLGGTVASAAATGTFLGMSATTWGIVSAGLTVAGTLAGYMGQQSQIDNQIKTIDYNLSQFDKNFGEQTKIVDEQFGLKQAQEHEKTMGELSDAQRAARIQMARARMSSGEAGVSGITVDRLMGEQVYEHGLAMANIQKQSEWNMAANELERKGKLNDIENNKMKLHAQYKQDKQNLKDSRPSALDAGLKIAGTLASVPWSMDKKKAPAGNGSGLVIGGGA